MESALDVPVPEGVDGLVVLFEYAGAERDLILGLKHNRAVGSVPDLADQLAAAVRTQPWTDVPTLVTWIPTTRGRRSERGYDQSLLLAKAVARRLHIPCRRLLVRSGRAQEGLGAVDRRVGPELATRRTVDDCVLVIDDVVTTGATLSAAAEALRLAGVPSVLGAALSYAAPHREAAPSRTRTIR